ncbi:MAG: hypothetical protein HKN20_03390 [Gemmatimonadetes bacterium]|nr:hypothetical protein [Gemmatimonadota bacterium]
MNAKFDHRSGGGKRGLDEQTLAAYMEGTLSDAERVRVEAALAEDDESLRGLVSARHLLSEIARDPVEAPAYAKVRAKNLAKVGFKIQPDDNRADSRGFFEKLAALFRGPRVMMGVAAATAVFALFLVRGGLDTDSGEVVRGGTETPAVQTLDLARGAAGTVAWAPMESTGRYVVRVYDVEGMIAYRAEVAEASVTIPQTTLDGLETGAEYMVEVEAIRPFDGNERFTVARFTISE